MLRKVVTTVVPQKLPQRQVLNAINQHNFHASQSFKRDIKIFETWDSYGPQYDFQKRDGRRTRISASESTKATDLPVALDIIPIEELMHRHPTDIGKLTEAYPGIMKEHAQRLPDDLPTLKTEGDVSAKAVISWQEPFHTILVALFKSMGIKGNLKFQAQETSENGTPDFVAFLDDEAMVAIDFKGPFAIRDREIYAAGAKSKDEKDKKLKDMKPPKVKSGKVLSLLQSGDITDNTRHLFQQLIHYCEDFGIRHAMAYDGIWWIGIVLPESGDSDGFLKVFMLEEPLSEKSTAKSFGTKQKTTHVSAAVTFFRLAYSDIQADKMTNSSKSKKESQKATNGSHREKTRSPEKMNTKPEETKDSPKKIRTHRSGKENSRSKERK